MQDNTLPSREPRPDSPTAETWIERLGSENTVTRSQAYSSLVNMGAAGVAPLVTALHHTNSTVRYYVAGALGDISDPRAVEPLTSAILGDEDENVRDEAISALGAIGDSRAVEPLIKLVQDGSEQAWIRSSAARALGQLGDTRAVEPLGDALLNDRSSAVRSSAAQALGLLADSRAVEPLIRALVPDLSPVEETDEVYEFEITWYSAWGLAQIGDPRAVEPLITLLKSSPDASLQQMLAIETLGALGDGRALPALEQLQQHDISGDEVFVASIDRELNKAIDQIKQRRIT